MKNMIFWLIRVSNKENWWIKWFSFLKFILVIKSIKVISSKNGTSDKGLSQTECGHHICQCIKLKVPIRVFGHQIFPKLTLSCLVWSIILTTFLLDITIVHHSVSMYLKEDTSTHILIIWLLQCPSNSMTEWLNMMTVPPLQLLKWLTMSQNTWSLLPLLRCQTLKWQSAWSWVWPHASIQFPTSSLKHITSTATLTDLRYMLLETEATKSSEKKLSKLIKSQVTGSVSTHEHAAVCQLGSSMQVFRRILRISQGLSCSSNV